MPTSDAVDSPLTTENAERNIQPFFILRKGSPRNSERKSAGRTKAKTRRRIDLTQVSPKSCEQSDSEFAGEHHDDQHLKTEFFHNVWSKIESTIKEVLRNINANIFNEIRCWVHESFKAICSRGMPDPVKASRSYPIITDPLSKLLHTGLLFTKNMELVDDLLTFEDLGLHLKSHGCHVANLSSYDFSTKNGIAVCLRSLLRQFMMASLDVADVSILASWYIEQGNCDCPLVVIIDDMEKCSGSVFSDFILMLSEWVVKLPVILIIGVATTVDSLKHILPSNALQHLSPHKFVLGSPTERMDAITEAILVKQCSEFCIGHKVAVFLRNYFIRQDGTLTSFIRALKIAVVQHIAKEPLSVTLRHIFKEDSQDSCCGRYLSLPDVITKRAFELPSFRRNGLAEPNGEIVAHGLSDLKISQKSWSSVVLCLYEAGKCSQITLLDLFCEALDPDLYHSMASDRHLRPETNVGVPLDVNHVHGRSQNSGIICQVIRKVRDLPTTTLRQMLNCWERHTEGISEIHEGVRELQSLLESKYDKGLKGELIDISKRQNSRSTIVNGNDAKALNDKAAALLKCMVKNHMLPVECKPLHEFSCFKDVGELQSALIGDPRRAIQVDLLEFHKFLKCTCCSKSGHFPFPSMHDTSIMYMLAQEHGDLINLHDWYQSFKTTIIQPRTKGKNRSKYSPSPKKRKGIIKSQNKSDASVQAQFCRAVTELQITGLLRMPSKRRPDYVQRVAFGL